MVERREEWVSLGARARVLGIAALSCLAGGCSFALVPYPPSEPSERTVDAAAECTASKTWPIVDTIGVGLSAR